MDQLILDVREVGESIVSISHDIQLLLPGEDSDEVNVMKKAKHVGALVENIISIVVFLKAIDFKSLDRYEELSDEVRKVEFSCFGLQSLLSQSLTNFVIFQRYEKDIKKFIKIVNTSANRIVTISYIAKYKLSSSCQGECTEELSRNGEENGCLEDKFKEERRGNADESTKDIPCSKSGCYQDKAECELACGGTCYEDENNQYDKFEKYPKITGKFKDSDINDFPLNEINILGREDVCYKDKATCELDCDGICIEDKSNQNYEYKKCPEYTETFTESTLTIIENGYDAIEQDHWHKPTDRVDSNDINNNINGSLIVDNDRNETRTDIANDHDVQVKRENEPAVDTVITEEDETIFENISKYSTEENGALSNSVLEEAFSVVEIPIGDSNSSNNDTMYKEETPNLVDDDLVNLNNHGSQIIKGECNKIEQPESSTEYIVKDHLFDPTIADDDATYSNETPITDYEVVNNDEVISSLNEYETTEIPSTDNYESSNEPATTEINYYETYETTTSTYEITADEMLTTTNDYDSYTTTEPTTPAYETTTEDLYKASQDIYSAAQDLSTKANEVSSITSDISSKISNINSMVSDLNSYDDDELTKKIQSVSKITQELSSKTSEISSLCSTTSSLASDISSASSDMPSADRNHRFKTSPWQKMSAKCQEMVTTCQSIVTAAQDILLKLDSVVSTTADLKVADAVSTSAFEVTAKTQLVISETLNIVSAVIELLNVIES